MQFQGHLILILFKINYKIYNCHSIMFFVQKTEEYIRDTNTQTGTFSIYFYKYNTAHLPK